jgi:hypothetical protein
MEWSFGKSLKAQEDISTTTGSGRHIATADDISVRPGL